MCSYFCRVRIGVIFFTDCVKTNSNTNNMEGNVFTVAPGTNITIMFVSL